MTDQEINVAIAEACGWTLTQADDGEWVTRHNGRRVFADFERWWPMHVMPNYCGDLNAMHEAEKSLNLCDYVSTLRRVVDSDWNKTDAVAYCCATARQRAEAFLRTIGKWQNTPQPATAHASA